MAIDVFIAYARNDESALEELVAHLAPLQRQGLIHAWYDRQVEAGDVWEAEIREHIEAAQMILLLVSADFLASPSCWDSEMERALRRQTAGAARVIPILLRACDWKNTPFGALSALPANEVPIQSWADRDQAWTQVVQKIRAAFDTRSSPPASAGPERPSPQARRLAEEPEVARARTRPEYPDVETRRLAEELERARARCNALKLAGEDTAEAQREVLALRRRLREGGQLRAGDRLGNGDRYLLLERTGRGGFANVWRARDDERSEVVAVKVLHTSLAEDSTRRERFFRGAQCMAALDHPGIVRVIEPHGEDGGFHFFVMEFVSGGDLHQAVLQKRLAAEAVVPLVLRVSEALGQAHAKGLVHRDVKPANILLEPSGKPRLTDFDLVAAADTTGGTRTGALGTFLYSAPEALDRPQDADARADVYGLGMTALFCLHGAPLPSEVLRDMPSFLRRVSSDVAVKAVLERAVAWKRDERFASMEDFSAALLIATRPPSAPRSQRIVTDHAVIRVAARQASVLPPPAQEAAVARARMPAAPVTAAAAVPPRVGHWVGTPEIEMVAIPGGPSWMGSTDDDTLAKDDERPRRRVQTAPFTMSRHPVTQRLYRQVMGMNPAQPTGDDLPVNHVSFWDAIEFCNRLSHLHHLLPACQRNGNGLTCVQEANGYRLPTEAEWELAARGADGRIYPWGNEPPSDQLAWSGSGPPRRGPSPVGSHPSGASPFGLLDMAGNVQEWCWDWYGYYPAAPGDTSKPFGPSSGSQRVIRGGSWRATKAHRLRAAARYCLPPDARTAAIGFRCVRRPGRRGASLPERSTR